MTRARTGGNPGALQDGHTVGNSAQQKIRVCLCPSLREDRTVRLVRFGNKPRTPGCTFRKATSPESSCTPRAGVFGSCCGIGGASGPSARKLQFDLT